jgi:hypothetical protein
MKISFLDLLTLLFIGLKLSDHIDWAWGIVLLPMMIEIVVKALITTIQEIKWKSR